MTLVNPKPVSAVIKDFFGTQSAQRTSWIRSIR